MEKGILKNLSTGKEFKIKRLPEFMVEILNEGGLIPYLKNHIDEIKQK